MTDTTTYDDYWGRLCDKILAIIDQKRNGRLRVSIPELMQGFGFKAERRVHQASLGWVLTTLNDWGIGYEFPGGTSAYDDILLFRIAADADHVRSVSNDASSSSDQQRDPGVDSSRFIAAPVSPISLLFTIDGKPDEAHNALLSQQIHQAIWAFRPVCLFVDANDELFSFLCGYVAAFMRRRALTVRSTGYETIRTSADVLTLARLKSHLGYSDSSGYHEPFPVDGAVYMVRAIPDELEDEEAILATREQRIPHTYTLIARFGATTTSPEQPMNLRGTRQFSQLYRWISVFAGTAQLAEPHEGQSVDISSLLADACQAADSMLFQQTMQPVDGTFRAGYESTEHMALKSVLLNYLRRSFPTEEIAVEQLLNAPETDVEGDASVSDRPRRDKPDLRVESRIWIEIETMRGLALRGSSPFFACEAKLRQKLSGMRSCEEVWLIVPSDLAVFGLDQAAAIARNLNSVLGNDKVRFGYVDLEHGVPVFLEPVPTPSIVAPRITGISLRQEPKIRPLPRSLDDIAGYEHVKTTLRSSLLDPLMKRSKYAEFGIFAARGLLLYGLPGCGKSWIGGVLADIAGISARMVLPSDLTSMWLGEGVAKTRALFDWAAKQGNCMLVLDELDAVAPQRNTTNMHTDEKRQVNELLVQLDRIGDKGIILIATTNYLRGIDAAIMRSGRFDMKLPIFPPTEADRRALFHYYLQPPRLRGFEGVANIDIGLLARITPLYTPADIRSIIQYAARQSIFRGEDNKPPVLTSEDVIQAVQNQGRSIRREQAEEWIHEVHHDLGTANDQLEWLKEEVGRAFR